MQTNNETNDCRIQENTVLDADGIERPKDTTAHQLKMPSGKKKLKFTKKKHILSLNPLWRFCCGCFIYIVGILILLPFAKLKYGFKVENKKALKRIKGKGAIMVGNHCHMLDVLFYRLATASRRNFLTSIPENFTIPFLRIFVKLAGTIPIPRVVVGLRLFNEVVHDRLENKNIVTFLPEGSMWPLYRDLRPFKKGAFRYAVRENIAVMPSCVSAKIIHKKNGKKKYKFTLTFFEPLYPLSSVSEFEAVTDLIERCSSSMRERIVSERKKDKFC